MPSNDPPRPDRAGLELFLVSLLILFMELACIRWFSAHVLFLTFFTNAVLLACFVGMSLGCLLANRRLDYLTRTPGLLLVAMIPAMLISTWSSKLQRYVDVGNQTDPQVIFFGAENFSSRINELVVPVEVIAGFFFLLIALVFVGPGQYLGRAFARYRGDEADPRRAVAAYTLNLLGSLAGIGCFALVSYLWLPPLIWFGITAGLLLLLIRGGRESTPSTPSFWKVEIPLLVSIVLVGFMTGPFGNIQVWSPYYRIDFDHQSRHIAVNQLGHQLMWSRDNQYNYYALPHALRRDTSGAKYQRILIIGAGSGSDVSQALQWADTDALIDAVEIDPVIQTLGAKYHPNQPYSDPRVRVYWNDGRNFLRNAPDAEYDLIIYALVDSLVLHSGYSNIRLESYLFTEQALADVRRCLKPDGVFAMYNYFRFGWLLARLQQQLKSTFDAEPICLMVPARANVAPDESVQMAHTLFLAGGGVEPIRQAFAQRPANIGYVHLEYDQHGYIPLSPNSPNGFDISPDFNDPSKTYTVYYPTRIGQPEGHFPSATDDWPFLYLYRPMVPDVNLRGILIMAGCAVGLALLLVWVGREKRATDILQPLRLDLRMFCLGAGFMLIETKAIVQTALLFGSTWMVNTVVIAGVLILGLLANLFVLKCNPQRLTPIYMLLFAAIGLNVFLPLETLLGLPRAVQVLLAVMLVLLPIVFAGVIFAVSFARRAQPNQAFGWNIAGALLGGLAENTSMLLGFQYLGLLALALYLLSIVGEQTSHSNAVADMEISLPLQQPTPTSGVASN